MSPRALRGRVKPPGDKSISHRALILAAMAERNSLIEGLSDSEDVRSTWSCLQSLGVQITRSEASTRVKGRGWRGFAEPIHVLDAGNSGTTLRLLMGVLAGNNVLATLDGDSSLRRRPMARVAEPLRRMGAAIDLTAGNIAPVTVRGGALVGIDFSSPVASAQVKSAVLLAGLLASGKTSVTETVLNRDHTERMLPCFGIEPQREGLKVTITGGLRLTGVQLKIPGDASSAAFFAVAATLVAGSEVRLEGVGVNPTRTGFLDVLKRMGARFELQPLPSETEPAADLVVRWAALRATDIEPSEVPRLIDEVPILALAASQAEGTSRFRGLGELRHKESDRLKAVAGLITALGGEAAVQGDDLLITGPRRLRGARVSSGGDHRIAMTALVAGLVAEGEVKVADEQCVGISYPSFHEDLARLLGR